MSKRNNEERLFLKPNLEVYFKTKIYKNLYRHIFNKKNQQ